ncbi:MAG: hypothetical protein AB1489_27460 [Acidobacteriota bacterium]
MPELCQIDKAQTKPASRWELANRELIAKLVSPLLPEQPVLNTEDRYSVETATINFVVAQIAAMPAFLRLPYQIALHSFNWLALLRYGRPYVRLDLTTRQRYVEMWADSPLGVMRDFVKLIRSCALLQYLDHPIALAQLEAHQYGNREDR